MEVMDLVWLGVTVLAAVVEAAVPSLVSIWFVPGGIAALATSLLGGPLWLQIVLFLAVSCVSLALTRPLAQKFQSRKKESTNADRVLGRTALVTEDIDNVLGRGRATVQGGSWAARSANLDGKIPRGSAVRVERIEGVKLVVTPLNPGENTENEA